MPNEVSRANDGPYDKRIFPPKWALEPISDEEYEQQKAEYEAISTTDSGDRFSADQLGNPLRAYYG